MRTRSEFKKSAVKLVSELSTDRPDRVERLSDKRSLFRRHDGNRRNQKSARQAVQEPIRLAYILLPERRGTATFLQTNVQRKHRRKRAEPGFDLLIGQHLGLRRFGAACRTSKLSLFLAVDDLDRPYAHELLTRGANPNGRRLRLARIRHWRLPLR